MINRLILQGRLVETPDVRQTQSGVTCAQFTVAWSEKYKEVETKCFQRCKAWRGTADFLAKYFAKGQELVVTGKMVTEQWEKDGQKHSAQICVADEVHFCGSKAAQGGAQAQENVPGNGYMPSAYTQSQSVPQPPQNAPRFETVRDDDVPF